MHKILANTLFLGKEIINLTDCHSTNEVALSMVRSGLINEGTLVIAYNQSRGKGQRGNLWESKPGLNLTFSLILFPSFLSINDQFILNMAIAIGVKQGLKKYVNDIEVKWPNDFYYKGKKLGGMLLENRLKGQYLDHSIIGLGINVNQTDFNIPGAISLKEILGEELDLNDVLSEILKHIEKWYLHLKTKSFKSIKETYQNMLYLYDKWATYDDGEIFSGKITGVGNFGHLEMRKQNGEYIRYELKQIRLIRND
jgi:BirA family biotin operon repressor/biotin-[acetyl-CoA-carboxylase] ligase